MLTNRPANCNCCALTRMRVTGFGRPTSSIVVRQGSGVTWTLSSTSASVHGDWQLKYRHSLWVAYWLLITCSKRTMQLIIGSERRLIYCYRIVKCTKLLQSCVIWILSCYSYFCDLFSATNSYATAGAPYDATDDDLRRYLKESNVDIRELKCISHSESKFKSFKLTVPVDQCQPLMSSDRWPSGVIVRQFVVPRL